MKYYAIYVCEDDTTERLVWFAYGQNDEVRQFFLGGSGIVPCIFTAAQSAHAMIKKIRKDFDDDAQFYVRKVEIICHEQD